jgi:hypothetical protein
MKTEEKLRPVDSVVACAQVEEYSSRFTMFGLGGDTLLPDHYWLQFKLKDALRFLGSVQFLKNLAYLQSGAAVFALDVGSLKS